MASSRGIEINWWLLRAASYALDELQKEREADKATIDGLEQYHTGLTVANERAFKAEGEVGQLRLAIKSKDEALLAHVKWHEEYDEYGGWTDSDLCELTYKALKTDFK
jgi:hypothetical protein